MKKVKSGRYGRSPTGRASSYSVGKSTVIAREYRDQGLKNIGQSGVAINVSFIKPTSGRSIQQGRIMPTACTFRSQGSIYTSVLLSQETAWALYHSLHEIFYDKPLDEED